MRAPEGAQARLIEEQHQHLLAGNDLEDEDVRRVLLASCLDANAAIFEVILSKEDIIIADRLVHASIVDGMKLSEADKETYKHSNMKHLEKKLKAELEKKSK